ncbi:MAG: septum formation family protein [Actinomycetaceae bacterium]|nr:septum formation family protein [Actinomycetaceae bacterium]
MFPPRLRRHLALAAAAVGTVVLAGCSTTVMDLKNGDCLNLPAELDLTTSAEFSVGSVEKVECSKDHQAEVIAVLDLETPEDKDFPGVEVLWDRAAKQCMERFEEYVGQPLEESSLEVLPLLPSEESWEQAGDREGLCVAYLTTGKANTTFKNYR